MNKYILRCFFVLSCFIWFLSCNTQNSNLRIEEDKLKKIFFDFHSAEYIVNRAPSNMKDSLKILFQQQIFSIHEVTKEDFMHDLELMKKNPEKFYKFYEQIESYSQELKNDAIKK